MLCTVESGSVCDVPISTDAATACWSFVKRRSRHRELHRGRRDAVHLEQRGCDLALQRSLVADALLEVGAREALLVEELEADHRAAGVGAGEVEARVGEVTGLHHHGRAAARELVRDAFLLQLVDDRLGLLVEPPETRTL